MSPTHRAIVFYLFVLLFLIALPVVLMIAYGYSWNTRTWRLEKTGVLLLEVTPEDARLTVDGVVIHEKGRSHGAIRLSKLSPGNLSIQFEKEGYLPLSAIVAVRPGLITAPPPIHLIKTTQAFMAFPYRPSLVASSPNRQWVALALPNTLNAPSIVLMDSSRLAIHSLPPLPIPLNAPSTRIDEFDWSNDNSALLLTATLQTQRYAFVFSLNSQSYSPTLALPKGAFLRWGSSSEILLMITNDGIIPISSSVMRLAPILPASTGVADLVAWNNQLLILRKESRALSLVLLGNKGTVLPLRELPVTSRFVQSAFPLPLIKTPTLLLILKRSNNGWIIANELPAADGYTLNEEEVITLDHGILYQTTADLPERSSYVPLQQKNFVSTKFELVPESPWLINAADNQVVLHPKPPLLEESGPPSPIVLENDLLVDRIAVDPHGRRALLMGRRNNESGVFLRIIRD